MLNLIFTLNKVVVVGSQSSGKSSVLEHLVGKSFLPRGSGIVTRCPLVLQLTQSKDGREYGVFQHDDKKIFTDYSLICQEIEQQTDRMAGVNKGICNTPIILKLFSPSHLDLTLIDLPGITKLPVGDQPPDIDVQTVRLTMEYVSNPKSIILAVIPANVDMATSESLKISRDVDPEGKRTLAVVTKLDIMDEGTNAMDMLNGKIIPVKLGIIGVVNRSQKDINEGKSIEDSLMDEAVFFKRKYEGIASKQGTAYLMKSVQQILINHIKTCLPDLKENVRQQLAKRKSELKAVDKSKMDQPSQLLDLINKFSSMFTSTIKGDLKNIVSSELSGGAKISYVFQNTLKDSLQSINAFTGLTKDAILKAVQNASGANPSLFTPQIAFELLIKRQMELLRSPCLSCIDLVHQELININISCLHHEEVGLLKYTKLQQEISDIVTDLLKIKLPLTIEKVNDFIDVELAYINTAHPDFKPFKHLVGSGTCSYDSFSNTNQNSNYELMKKLIESYFSIVRKTIQDIVPKMIMHFLVNFVVNCLQSQLLVKLYWCDKSADLLEESCEVIAERTRLENDIIQLERANDILNMMNSPHMSG